MRTTLTIDDQLAATLKEVAHRSGKPFKQVVNEAFGGRGHCTQTGAAQVILVDANLLLYAVNRDLPQHRIARSWFEKVLSGSEGVGLPWVVLLAFLRITTGRRIFERPLTVESANAYVDQWLSQPVVTIVVPGIGHWSILRNLLAQTGTGGNLTTEAG